MLDLFLLPSFLKKRLTLQEIHKPQKKKSKTLDPNVAYRKWRITSDLEEAIEAHTDLLEWLKRGGFQPAWSDSERAKFMNWDPVCDVRRVN